MSSGCKIYRDTRNTTSKSLFSCRLWNYLSKYYIYIIPKSSIRETSESRSCFASGIVSLYVSFCQYGLILFRFQDKEAHPNYTADYFSLFFFFTVFPYVFFFFYPHTHTPTHVEICIYTNSLSLRTLRVLLNLLRRQWKRLATPMQPTERPEPSDLYRLVLRSITRKKRRKDWTRLWR